jgi:hypothetical protein
MIFEENLSVMRRFLTLLFLLASHLFSASHLFAYEYFKTTTGIPWHWPTRNIKYWINPEGSGLSSDQILTTIQSTFQSWEQTGVGLTFSFMGFTDSQNNLTDHKNVIFWSSDRTIIPAGAYGITIPNVDATTGEIQDMDIALNQKTALLLTESQECGGSTIFNLFGIPLVWNLTEQRFEFGLLPGTDRYSVQVQATVTHEIGHLLGLKHSSVPGASMSTIFITPIIWCSTTQAVLKVDDINGIKFLYPPAEPPPIITSLTANPTSVQVGGQSTISIQASDADGDPLTYEWSATCGTLSSTTGAGNKTWTAPSTVSTCTVTATVTDPSGANATAHVDIEVTPESSTTFHIHDRVATTDNLNVRSAPGLSGVFLGVQPTSSQGTVIGGPVFAGGFWWWQIDYDTGPDGWSAENFLGLAPPLPIQGAYTTFSVFNRTIPRAAFGRASGATVAVFNRTLSAPETTGERVYVNTGDGSNLNVRGAPGLSGIILGVQPTGSQGTVIGGPVFADGFWWWQVNFDTGADGWVAGDFLEPPPQHLLDAHTSLAAFNSAAPDALTGHVAGPVFSLDNAP